MGEKRVGEERGARASTTSPSAARGWLSSYSVESTEAAHQKAKAEVEACSKATTKAEADEKACGDVRDAANRDHAAAHTKAQQAEADYQKALKDVKRSEKVLSKERKDAERLVREYNALQAAQLDTATSGVEDLNAIVEAMDEDKKEATTKIDILTDHAAAKALQMERNAAMQEAKDRRTDAKELSKALTRVLQRLLGEMVEPFLEPISVITNQVLGTSAYADLSDGFEFGCQRDTGVRVPWSTCSESQQMVLLLAFAVGIQGKLSGWRRLIVDGLECMDATRRTLFVQAMQGCVDRGELDNFIAASVTDGWTAPEGVLVVEREVLG